MSDMTLQQAADRVEHFIDRHPLRREFEVLIDHARAAAPSVAAPPREDEGSFDGSFDRALAWVRQAAWDTPSPEQCDDEDTIPREHMGAVSRVLMRKYRAIAARLVAERPIATAPGTVRDPERAS